MFSFRKRALFLAVCLLSQLPSLGSAQTDSVFQCVPTTDTVFTSDSGSIGEFKVDSIDTLKAVVIYACGTYASTDTLAGWWGSVWDSAQPQVKGKNA